MAKIKIVQFRRRREGRTNYKRRLNLLKSGIPRLVVRKSLKHITSQIVQYSPKGDKVLATVNSKSLEKMGWPVKGNTPSAYLTGLLMGRKAAELNIKKVVLDMGMHPSIRGSRIYALIKGALDTGLEIPHSDDVLPADDEIYCKSIEEYAKKIKSENADLYKRQFSGYIKNDVDPSSLGKIFENTKNKIIGAKNA